MTKTSVISPPDRKRPRVEEAGDGGSWQGPKNSKHPALYFRDGNVILRCRGTDFRVHNTLLSKNSPVFLNLFAANELNIDKEHPGCIIVSLDDDADDIENLLHRVYDGFHIGTSKLDTTTFPSIASLLRTSTKYKIQRPREAIFELFHQEWPSTLDFYDEEITHATQVDNVHPAAVICVLLECGYSSTDLLRPLFYELTTCASKLGDPESGRYLASFSTTDIQRFLVGLNALRGLQARLAICPLEDIPHQSCRSCLATIWCNTAYSILANKLDENCHPLRDWEELINLFDEEQKSNSPPIPLVRAPPAAPPPPYQTPQLAPQALPQQNTPRYQSGVMYVHHGGVYANVFPHHNAGPIPMQGVAGQGAPQVGYHMGQAHTALLAPYMHPNHARQAPRPALPPPAPINPTMCPPCKQILLTHLQACRQKLWDSIPTLFKLT
ncbi:hypothetical protein BDZ94DRAFT_1323642 [Collybia nuda]|uniref:BTB domain-containing protein n=1 Tax=Collybia nuda TaxID=64659 RepID=A0A9P5Y2E5_9AGAR|nr:hypothetical protein BDZ94DRAFT_1323642 [Collybia nuda]